MKLILRWAAVTLALFAAVYLVPGITVDDPNAWTVFVIMALILGLVNALVRPFLKLLSCPLILLTLGLFVLVINGASFLLASRIAESLGVGFYVDGYWSAFLGAFIVSVVSVFFNIFLKDHREDRLGSHH
jgi:putative membrane protein